MATQALGAATAAAIAAVSAMAFIWRGTVTRRPITGAHASACSAGASTRWTVSSLRRPVPAQNLWTTSQSPWKWI
eukprot:6315036-Prorocentrum_lima.AAC.1